MMADDLQQIEDSLLRYAHEMHEYTLQLWADSRKAAEEKKEVKGSRVADTAKQRRVDLMGAKSRVVDGTERRGGEKATEPDKFTTRFSSRLD